MDAAPKRPTPFRCRVRTPSIRDGPLVNTQQLRDPLQTPVRTMFAGRARGVRESGRDTAEPARDVRGSHTYEPPAGKEVASESARGWRLVMLWRTAIGGLR